MKNAAQATIDYFRPPPDAFWQWAEKGEVIEWIDNGGKTICYREDLVQVLRGLLPGGWPALSVVVLVLDACKPGASYSHEDAWPTENDLIIELTEWGLLGEDPVWRNPEEERSGPSPEQQKDDALLAACLSVLPAITELPLELKSGDKRVDLLSTLSEQALAVSAKDSRILLREFESGKYDASIFYKNKPGANSTLGVVAEWLVAASQLAPNAEKLEMLLRTGVSELPPALPTEIPKMDFGALLEQLDEDNRTIGLSRLAYRIAAALNIPLHARGSSDQPFGGVSDITNRGDFDRLLLSELAYDDTTLMARLANNEALYLRREEPPQNLVQQRTILVDTTLKMWGIPRVFALSAALACTQHKQQELEICAFALGGSRRDRLQLDDREGVLHSLELLDPALHCGRALDDFFADQGSAVEAETILITEAENVQQAAFKAHLRAASQGLDYLITVARDGRMELFQYIGERRKPLSSAQFDLAKILFKSRKPPVRKPRKVDILPAFYVEEGKKLRFPTVGIRFYPNNTYSPNYYNGVMAVSQTQRVLFWNYQFYGARELLSFVEQGTYVMGRESSQVYYLVVKNADVVFLYQFYINEDRYERLVLPRIYSDSEHVYFHNKQFYFQIGSTERQRGHYHVISPETGALVDEEKGLQMHILLENSGSQDRMDVNLAKKVVNNGYTVLQKVNSISVNGKHQIRIGKRILQISEGGVIKWMVTKDRDGTEQWADRTPQVENYDAENPHLRFVRFTWKDGSVGLVDTRGFLHLQSSNVSIPEITIPLIIGKPTAAWTSGGFHYGSSYFTEGEEKGDHMEMAIDFAELVTEFIDHILRG